MHSPAILPAAGNLKLSALLLAAACISWALDAPRTVTGNYIEARSNHVFGCYCEWSGESQTGGREAILAWEFKAGQVDGVPLSGVKVGAVLVADSTLSSGNPPRRSVLFIDDSATASQQHASETFLRGAFSELLGRVLDVSTVPIVFETGPETASVRFGDAVSLVMRKAKLPQDALQGSRLWYDPFIPLTGSTLGTTLEYKFGASTFDYRWEKSTPEISGYFGTFSLPAPEP